MTDCPAAVCKVCGAVVAACCCEGCMKMVDLVVCPACEPEPDDDDGREFTD